MSVRTAARHAATFAVVLIVAGVLAFPAPFYPVVATLLHLR